MRSDESVEPKTIGPTLTLGFVRRDFMFRVWSKDDAVLPLRLSRTSGANASLLGDGNAHDIKMTLSLQFSELLPGVFRNVVEEGPGANCGTRFKVKFKNVPKGVHLFVTTRNMPSHENAASAVLLSPEDGTLINDSASEPAVGGVPIVEVALHNGEGTAVWEWINGDSASVPTLNELLFGVAVSAKAGNADLGLVTVEGCLAPSSYDYCAEPNAWIPRFADVPVSSDVFRFV
jgi:hypothetical protein